MNNNNISFADAFAKFGKRNLAASLMVIVFFVALIVVYFFNLSSSIKESIITKGELNAVQSADRFDRYLLTGMDSIKLASHTIDTMLQEERSNEEILEYMTEEMIAVSGVGSEGDFDIPFGGIDTGDPNLDPESRVPFGNFIFGE